MAKFKVGDKARIIDAPDMKKKHWIGCEVTILRLPGWSWHHPDSYEISRPATEARHIDVFSAPARHLAPLTDPKADEFIARLEKLGHEPVIQPVEVER